MESAHSEWGGVRRDTTTRDYRRRIDADSEAVDSLVKLFGYAL